MIKLEDYGHTWTMDGPGTTRGKMHLRPIISAHKMCTYDLVSDFNYQIYVRYGYVKAKMTGEHLDQWTEIYKKIQLTRVGVEKLDEFNRLIGSFSQFGYSFERLQPIPVGLDLHILDGSHRIACCLYFNANPFVEQYDIPTHPYDKTILEKMCEPQEIQLIEQAREEIILKKTPTGTDFIGFVRGDGLLFWEEIIHEFGEANLSRFFIKYYGGDRIKDVIKTTYHGDGISEERLERKAMILRHRSTSVGVLSIKNIINLSSITEIKKRIRSKLAPRVSDYYFDSIIHIIDDPSLGSSVLSELGL